MAILFESLVKSDKRFELPAERHLGLVVFRLKGENELTEQLLKEINSGGQIHCVPASIKGKYIIRFTITATSTNADDIHRDWIIIQIAASKILRPLDSLTPQERRNTMKHLHDDFRMSLVLSNTPHSPCLINGSFAAILPLNTRHIYAMTHELSQRGKQMSMDGCMINSDQQKCLLPILPLSLPISRQGSLDSRIEEILENNASENKGTNEYLSTPPNGHADLNIIIPKIVKE
jgi:histidine decarboxylase